MAVDASGGGVYWNQMISNAHASSAKAARQSGFTLIELLVIVAILVVLLALIIPILSAAHSRAMQAKCASNLRQVGVALTLFAADNNDFLPPGGPAVVSSGLGNRHASSYKAPIPPSHKNLHLVNALAVYLGQPDPYTDNGWRVVKQLQCPAFPDLSSDPAILAEQYTYYTPFRVPPSYTGGNPFGEWNSTKPSRCFASLASDYKGLASIWLVMDFVYSHRGLSNVLFADGHVLAYELLDSPNYVLDPAIPWYAR